MNLHSPSKSNTKLIVYKFSLLKQCVSDDKAEFKAEIQQAEAIAIGVPKAVFSDDT